MFAKDMKAMVAFYQQVLGLEEVKTPDTGRNWRVLKAGSVELALHGIPKRYADGIVILDPPEPRSAAVTKLVFQVDDLPAVRASLLDQGVVEVHQEILNTGDELIRCDFLDPEGNVIQISSS